MHLEVPAELLSHGWREPLEFYLPVFYCYMLFRILPVGAFAVSVEIWSGKWFWNQNANVKLNSNLSVVGGSRNSWGACLKVGGLYRWRFV